jgi:hypothetical protein
MIKDGAVVIDVGTNHVGGRLVGDSDFDSIKNKNFSGNRVLSLLEEPEPEIPYQADHPEAPA